MLVTRETGCSKDRIRVTVVLLRSENICVCFSDLELFLPFNISGVMSVIDPRPKNILQFLN